MLPLHELFGQTPVSQDLNDYVVFFYVPFIQSWVCRLISLLRTSP